MSQTPNDIVRHKEIVIKKKKHSIYTGLVKYIPKNGEEMSNYAMQKS